MPSIQEINLMTLRTASMTSSNVPPVLYMYDRVLCLFSSLDFALKYTFRLLFPDIYAVLSHDTNTVTNWLAGIALFLR
jgi:hypothetical protein